MQLKRVQMQLKRVQMQLKRNFLFLFYKLLQYNQQKHLIYTDF
jgi:hypothetical protein